MTVASFSHGPELKESEKKTAFSQLKLSNRLPQLMGGIVTALGVTAATQPGVMPNNATEDEIP